MWCGTHYKSCDLDNLGYVICLGHQGNPCPSTETSTGFAFATDDTLEADLEKMRMRTFKSQKVWVPLLKSKSLGRLFL
jgi:hypothetical protein